MGGAAAADASCAGALYALDAEDTCTSPCIPTSTRGGTYSAALHRTCALSIAPHLPIMSPPSPRISPHPAGAGGPGPLPGAAPRRTFRRPLLARPPLGAPAALQPEPHPGGVLHARRHLAAVDLARAGRASPPGAPATLDCGSYIFTRRHMPGACAYFGCISTQSRPEHILFLARRSHENASHRAFT